MTTGNLYVQITQGKQREAYGQNELLWNAWYFIYPLLKRVCREKYFLNINFLKNNLNNVILFSLFPHNTLCMLLQRYVHTTRASKKKNLASVTCLNCKVQLMSLLLCILEDKEKLCECLTECLTAIPMFLQCSAPSSTSLGEEDHAAAEAPGDIWAGGGHPKWPRSSAVRRWAWCSSSCRWRLLTAAWLSSGSWVWSSSEMWVVPCRHSGSLEMFPRCLFVIPQSSCEGDDEHHLYRVVEEPLERTGPPQSWSYGQVPCRDPTGPWVPTQCSVCPWDNSLHHQKMGGSQWEFTYDCCLCHVSLGGNGLVRPRCPHPQGNGQYCPAIRSL